MSKAWSVIFTCVILSACVSSSDQYYWGNYEGLIYKMYIKPGEAPPEVQVERLTRDLQRAEAKGMRIPPGVFLHLGVMYALTGNLSAAENAFNEEKVIYPESTILVDGMLARARKNLKPRKGSDNAEDVWRF